MFAPADDGKSFHERFVVSEDMALAMKIAVGKYINHPSDEFTFEMIRQELLCIIHEMMPDDAKWVDFQCGLNEAFQPPSPHKIFICPVPSRAYVEEESRRIKLVSHE